MKSPCRRSGSDPFFLTLLTIIFPALCAAGWGADDEGPRKAALLIGVNRYQKPGFSDLQFAEADVQSVADELRKLDFEVTILLGSGDGSEQATLENIEAAAVAFVKPLGKSDIALVMLSGHGQTLRLRDDAGALDEAYFCPVDARVNDRDSQFSLSHLLDDILAPNVAKKIVLVDACRDVPVDATIGSRSTKGIEGRFVRVPEDTAIFFSCRAGQMSFERNELEHGLFTHCLLEAFRSPLRAREIAWSDVVAHVSRRMAHPDLTKYMPPSMHQVPIPAGAMSYTVLGRFEVPPTVPPIPTTPTNPATGSPALSVEQPEVIADVHDQPAFNLQGQDAASRQVVQGVVQLLEGQHVTVQSIDEDLVARWIEQMLVDFESQNLYLLESDVVPLRARRQQIHTELHRGEIDIAYDLMTSYLPRRHRYVQALAAALHAEHDFSVDERFYPRDRSSRRFGSDAEQDEFIRVHAKWLLLQRMVTRDVDLQEARAMALRDIRTSWRDVLRYDDAALQGLALAALAHACDPHSNFFTRSQLDDFMISMRAEIAGVGMATKTIDGEMEVERLIEGGPAHRLGRLSTGDRIIAIGQGVSGDWTAVSDLSQREAVALMRGDPGTTVRLQFKKQGSARTETCRIVRAKVDLSANAISSRLLTVAAADGTKSKVGYVAMPTFYTRNLLAPDGQQVQRDCVDDLREELIGLKRDGCDVIVLDLSQNTGGALSISIEMAGLFMPSGVTLATKSRAGKVSTYAPQKTPLTWDGPLVLAVSRLSAGGPEILAGALQDSRRGLVAGGWATHGMGTTANLLDPTQPADKQSGAQYPAGSIRVTREAFYRPSGTSTQLVGINADIWIPSIYDQMKTGEGMMDNVLEVEPVAPSPFQRYHYVTDHVIRTLQRMADERRHSAPEFAEYLEQIERYHSVLDRGWSPLTEQGYREDHQTSTALVDEFAKQVETNGDPVSEFSKEAIAVAADYAAYVRDHADQFSAPRLLREGRYTEALPVLDRLITASPEDRSALRWRSQARGHLGQWPAALADAQSAGESAIKAFATDKITISVKGKPDQSIAVRQRCRVTHVNDDWLYIVDDSNPEVKGWTQSKSILPLLDGQ